MDTAAPRLSPELTVNEVVRSFPATLTVFTRHGMDTCCGGGHPVAEAARRHGIDLQRLMAELASAV